MPASVLGIGSRLRSSAKGSPPPRGTDTPQRPRVLFCCTFLGTTRTPARADIAARYCAMSNGKSKSSVRPCNRRAFQSRAIMELLEQRLLLAVEPTFAAPTFATPLYDKYWIDNPRAIGIDGA